MAGKTIFRVGHGMDVHPFQEGRPLIIGGVTIPSSRGLKGHSDADVLIHAVVDALLGAAGKGDIGTFFPDTEIKWKGADSKIFLKSIAGILSDEQWEVQNIDCCILAQSPRLSPHIADMKTALAGVLSISPDQIGIKATTTERLGFVGREEGIVASVCVLLAKQN